MNARTGEHERLCLNTRAERREEQQLSQPESSQTSSVTGIHLKTDLSLHRVLPAARISNTEGFVSFLVSPPLLSVFV